MDDLESTSPESSAQVLNWIATYTFSGERVARLDANVVQLCSELAEQGLNAIPQKIKSPDGSNGLNVQIIGRPNVCAESADGFFNDTSYSLLRWLSEVEDDSGQLPDSAELGIQTALGFNDIVRGGLKGGSEYKSSSKLAELREIKSGIDDFYREIGAMGIL